jgi:hypothetical protein
MIRVAVFFIVLGTLFWWIWSNPDPQEKTIWCGASGYFSKC